ncbi:YoaK family protein [Streptococcus sp. 32226D021BW]
MKQKDYRVFEGLRVACCLTFISGYLNAFTYVTQGGRFAGVQSGNVISLAYYMTKGDFVQVLNFCVPILFFVIGQFFTYLARKYFEKQSWSWHFGSSLIMLICILLTIFLSPMMPASFTIASLAFVASIQVETFRRLRGAPYANVMMTGNVKNAAYLWFKGMIERDAELKKTGRNILLTIIGFMLGVISATQLSFQFKEYALIGILLPVLYINYQLWQEKRPISR